MLQLNVFNILASQCVYIVRGKGDVVYVFFSRKDKSNNYYLFKKKNFCQQNLIFSTHFFDEKKRHVLSILRLLRLPQKKLAILEIF